MKKTQYREKKDVARGCGGGGGGRRERIGNRGRFRGENETTEYVRVSRRALGVAAPLDRDKGALSAARRGGSYQRSRSRASPRSPRVLSLSLTLLHTHTYSLSLSGPSSHPPPTVRISSLRGSPMLSSN